MLRPEILELRIAVSEATEYLCCYSAMNKIKY